MSTVLTLLAVLGIAAAAWHLVRAAFRFLRQGATDYLTKELARNHARRGDVTSYEEKKKEQAELARSKRREGLVALGWLVLLVAPSFSSWAQPIYAALAALWVVPVARRSRSARRVEGGPS